jgi:hypothetical protein
VANRRSSGRRLDHNSIGEKRARGGGRRGPIIGLGVPNSCKGWALSHSVAGFDLESDLVGI